MSYYDTYNSRDFTPGTSEDDQAEYDEQVQSDLQEVKDGIRDPSYLENLKKIEDQKPVTDSSGNQYNLNTDIYQQKPSQEELNLLANPPLGLDTGISYDEDRFKPLTREDGTSIYQKPEFVPPEYQEGGSKERFKELDQNQQLSGNYQYWHRGGTFGSGIPREPIVPTQVVSQAPNFISDSGDVPISKEEREILSGIASKFGSILGPQTGPGSGLEEWAQLEDLIERLNAIPELARIYGGADGIVTLEDSVGNPVASGYQGISNTFDNLLSQRFARRSHLQTPRDEMGLRENMVEIGNQVGWNFGNIFRDAITLPERIYDEAFPEWMGGGTKRQNTQGQMIDTKTGQPYRPEVLDWEIFKSLDVQKPWTKTKWGADVGAAAYHLPIMAATWFIGGGAKGFFAMQGISGLPGFRKPLSGGAVRDGFLFLPGNILRDRTAFGQGIEPYSPEFVSAAVEQDLPLYQWKAIAPEFGDAQHLIANGFWNHPSVIRFLTISELQGYETIGSWAFGALGGGVLKLHRSLDNIFGTKFTGHLHRKYIKGVKWKDRPLKGGAKGGLIKEPLKSLERIRRSMYAGETAPTFEMTGNQWIWRRLQNAKNLNVNMARSQLNNPNDWMDSSSILNSNIGGFKLNSAFKQPGQGVSLPIAKPVEILEQANVKSLEAPMGVSGSTDALFSPLKVRRMAIDGVQPLDLSDISKKLQNDPRYLDALKSIPKAKRTLRQLHELVLQRQQELIGRDAARLSPEEFWNPIILDQPLGTNLFDDLDLPTAWSLDNIISADLVNSSLLTQLRDRAIAAKEIDEVADIFTTDGPIRSIADNLVVGLTNIKRSRYLWNLLSDKVGMGKFSKEMIEEINEKVAKRTLEFNEDNKEGVRMMLELLEQRNSDEVAHAVLEMFSMSNDIHNWADFDAFMKAKLFGGEFAGKTGDAVLIRELQGVMINSVLSGPKTPLRALLGTAANSYFNGINEAAGALIRTPFTGDIATQRAALAKAKGLFELIPESWTVFRRKMSANWSGDIRQIKTRYHTQRGGKSDQPWELFKAYGEVEGSDGLKAAINIGDTARALNDNKWTTGNIRIMASIDDTFKWLLARIRSKEKGLRQVLQEMGDDMGPISKEALAQAEDIHYNHLLDTDGNLDLSKDMWLRKQFEEVTLTEDIGKLGEALDRVFEVVPTLKPFYLFARSGINGLKVSFKNTPAVSLLMEESRAILQHTGDDFSKLRQFGIDNAEDLANARNLFTGRQAVGSAVAMSIFTKYAAGELTGNGPADKQLKQSWINSGWKPNTITFGNVEFNYSSLEPYNLLLSAIADIGDNTQLMGSEWSEKRLQAVAFVIGRGLTGKTYLSGLDQLMQMVQGRNIGKNMANVLNNSLPLAGLRNEIGKFLNPHMKELNSSMWASLRNRNQWAEPLAHLNPWLDPLAEKSDMLNGQPLNDWNFIQRAFNTISPIQISIKSNSPGRLLLQQSNYDLKSTTFSYNGYSFTKSAKARSLFQNAIGNASFRVGHKNYKNLEHYLDELAKDADIQASVAKMKRDSQNPANWDLDPNVAYNHNRRIDAGVNAARRQAWAAIQNHPIIIELIREQENLKTKQIRSSRESSSFGRKDALLKLNNP